jgi:PAS domain-containing protein
MSERKRFLILIIIMVVASVVVAGITISMLYGTAFNEAKARLVETAQSQARLIEAVARFDAQYSKDYPGGSKPATLSQIIDAHENYKGFGKTGEFTLSEKVEDDIVFLLSHRHYDLDKPQPVPFKSNLAEPMKRALSGKSGTAVGLDYRGEMVLAAHEPVRELNFGIVAKIDLSEIRAPFVKTGAIAELFTIIVVLIGTSLFIRISNPIIRQLEDRAIELEKINDDLKREIDRHIQTQKALENSEEIFSKSFLNSPVTIALTSVEDGLILDLNESFIKTFGWGERKSLVGHQLKLGYGLIIKVVKNLCSCFRKRGQ